MKKFSGIFLLFLITGSFAQVTYPVNGVADERSGKCAFIHASLIVRADSVTTNGMLFIEDGLITYAGVATEIPKDAVVYDLKGKYIYPAFIDLDADYGLPKKENPPAARGPQFLNNNTEAVSWNQAITPEFNSNDVFAPDAGSAEQYRMNGFAMVLTSRHDGIMRGTGAFVFTGDERAGEMIALLHASNNLSFNKGSSTQDYPSSEMGVIALLRQTYYDADWYAKGGQAEEKNNALQAINANSKLPSIIQVSDKLQVLRADKVGDEFNIQYIIRGGGDAYQRVDEIKKTGAGLIIPLNFPKTPDVSNPYDAELLTLGDLKHWEMAPANAAMLQYAGIPFAITSSGLENAKDFLPNLRKAVAYGLDKNAALDALTMTPATWIHAETETGSLQKGKYANFFIASGDIFDKNTTIYQEWVKGKPYMVNTWVDDDPRGVYALHIKNKTYGLIIGGRANKPSFDVIKLADTIHAEGSIENGIINLTFFDATEIRLSGWMQDKNFAGTGQIAGTWTDWNAQFANVYADKNNPAKEVKYDVGKVCYPFTAFGWEEAPEQKDILITNATIWTGEKEGVLEHADILLSNGKIMKIGKNISAKNALVIDGTGKYVTAGIIDEHSHIAISNGVNEGTQAVTSEVRIGDVLDCEDINIYRQLSGGVTCSHLLHGSANPIGGQTQLIKLRWGRSPEEMKFAGWPGFIKFALGENVKQSNWGDNNTTRFPQTRMGVEQVYEDAFTRAEAYMAAKKDRTALLRTDLELEALEEILESKRFITCHSYVQSEINMLMHVAQRHGFRVNTFTHILEGYKVADKMVAHGAGGSTFSDWWAYKFEVYEAIPQNAGIMMREGVVVAINSDDAEMGRRLNQEAAKSIKYMGMSEQDAWKMVTINPAKLLHVDDKVGSLKEGKDADVVVWSNDPLSIYAIAEKTIIDGIIYYDRDKEAILRSSNDAERARIIAKMLKAKNNGDEVVPVEGSDQKEYHCDDMFDFVKGNQ
ncbi:MAG: amidohydrolase family protein [Chitinophagales bacterium]